MIKLGEIVKRWQTLSSVAAIAVAAMTASFRPPPVGESSNILAVGTLIATVCAGLIYVAMIRWSGHKHLARWVVAATAGALAAMASFYVYETHWDSYVATYQGQQQIVGDEYTPEGAEWVKRQGQKDASRMLFDAGGEATQIWTPESIARVKARMRFTYLAGYPLIALAILSTVQAVYCARQQPKRKTKPKVAKPPAAAGSAG